MCSPWTIKKRVELLYCPKLSHHFSLYLGTNITNTIKIDPKLNYGIRCADDQTKLFRLTHRVQRTYNKLVIMTAATHRLIKTTAIVVPRDTAEIVLKIIGYHKLVGRMPFSNTVSTPPHPEKPCDFLIA